MIALQAAAKHVEQLPRRRPRSRLATAPAPPPRPPHPQPRSCRAARPRFGDDNSAWQRGAPNDTQLRALLRRASPQRKPRNDATPSDGRLIGLRGQLRRHPRWRVWRTVRTESIPAHLSRATGRPSFTTRTSTSWRSSTPAKQARASRCQVISAPTDRTRLTVHSLWWTAQR
jgi:hypothetical protein